MEERRKPILGLTFGLLAVLMLLLAFAARADAYVYWANQGTTTLARANLAGTDANLNFIGSGSVFNPRGVTVDADHIYWANRDGHSIGRADISGGSCP